MIALHHKKEAFLKHCEGFKGYSSLTISSYDESITQMIQYADIESIGEEIHINLIPLRLKISVLKAKTIARKLSAVRSFVKYLRDQGMTVFLKADESIKVPKTLPKPVSHDHILSALSQAPMMERLAILMLYTMGLRISELAMLRTAAVGEQWCRVMGKGSKERDVPVLAYVYEAINQYKAQMGEGEFLFESNGVKLSENSLRYSIMKVFKEVGLHVTPHQLRHAYATELLNNNARIADVSELLGHSSMATTQIYTKLGNALKMDHYLKSHPLCHKTEDKEC
ncbi:MAG TPA: tyrosine-type recombinase/integrase [Sulfuricurvum sp.]|nr:MAG: integrase [Campylobacterales bacterium 16-40-21]OZA03364.1 MAG: integrase [Sulfuricurvum sp. 17-40-25]HQS66552.1 tyrosine-type recombinase/integrase [Sulfuricurvum sp.]HQT35395.1 tyrosine-type recombinase/integrase [Sulfuricurvum sp.]